MKPKERLLSSLRGEPVDRLAWSPFLAYWWESQSAELTSQGQLAYMERIGADPMLRGFGAAFRMRWPGVDISESSSGERRLVRWCTPVGELSFGYHHSNVAQSWFLMDHPVKSTEDLKVLMWIYEHAVVEGNPDLADELRDVGARALIIPTIGAECKTCFQSLVEKYIGTEQLCYILMDEPDAVEDCLEVMRCASVRTATLSAESDADAFIFWEDSSTTNISPTFFARYAAPEIEAWGNVLHASGKLLVHHACGHIKDLLPLIAKLPVDAIESISPPPTGNIDIAEAFALLPPHIGLIGGIEPVFFEQCTIDGLDARVDELVRISKGRRYMLANSDSCPPGVSAEKLQRVSERVASGGGTV